MISRIAQVCFQSVKRLPSAFQFSVVEPKDIGAIRPLKSNQETLKQISDAQTLKQLAATIDLSNFTQEKNFRPILRKFTKLLDRTEDDQIITFIENFLYEVRRFSSSEVKSNTNDIMNYHLMFKRLAYCFPREYKVIGFEIRIAMIAETLPGMLELSKNEAKSVALLHYLTSYTEISTTDMKTNIFKYLVTYFKHQNNMQSPWGVAEQYKPVLDEEDLNVDHTASCILMSGSQKRYSKNMSEYFILEVAYFNMNKFWSHISAQLGVERILKPWRQAPYLLLSSQRSPQAKYFGDLLKNTVQDNGSRNQKERIVISSEEQFLICAQSFHNVLSFDYFMMIKSEPGSNECSKALSYYFEAVFEVSDKMRVNVALDAKDLQIDLNRPIQTKVINLWKVAATIVKDLSNAKIPVERRANILNLILERTLTFLDDQQHSLTVQQRQEIIREYNLEISQILTFMPVAIIEKLLTAHQEYAAKLKNLLLRMSLLLPKTPAYRYEQINRSKQARHSFISLVRTKGQIVATPSELVTLFQNIIAQDESLEFHEVYFCLANYQGPCAQLLHQLIPMDQLVRRINQKKKELIELRIGSDGQKKDPNCYKPELFNMSKEDKDIVVQNASKNFAYQADILKVYALSLMLGTEETIFAEGPPCSHQKLEISLKQFDELFNLWINAFSYSMLGSVESTSVFLREFEFTFSPIYHYLKPIAYFETFYYQLFEETKVFDQFRLIDKVLTHKNFRNYFLFNKSFSSINFPCHLKVLLLGLANKERQAYYISRYPAKEIIPEDLRISAMFLNFKYSFYGLLLNEEQWRYYLEPYEINTQVELLAELVHSEERRAAIIAPNISEHFRSQLIPSEEEQVKIKRMIIQKLLASIKDEKNYIIVKKRKIAFVIKFISKLGVKRDEPCAFMSEAMKDELMNDFMTSNLYLKEKQTAFSIFALNQMGFIDQEAAQTLLKTSKWGYNDFGAMLLLFKSKQAIKIQRLREMEKNASVISSMAKFSLLALELSIYFTEQENCSKMINIIKNINFPSERLHLLKRLHEVIEQKFIFKYRHLIKQSIQQVETQIKRYHAYEIIKAKPELLEHSEEGPKGNFWSGPDAQDLDEEALDNGRKSELNGKVWPDVWKNVPRERRQKRDQGGEERGQKKTEVENSKKAIKQKTPKKGFFTRS